MSTKECTVTHFCRVGYLRRSVAKQPQAVLHPSEVATLTLLFALKGVGERDCYRSRRTHEGRLQTTATVLLSSYSLVVPLAYKT